MLWYRYIEVCLLSLSPFSMICIIYWRIARLVIFPQPYSRWNIFCGSIIPAKLRCIGIADAEICHSGDICKIFRSRYCVRITVLNLQVLKVYTYKPAKNFAFKNRLINSFTFVRTLICKTVQISANSTSIQPCIQTKKECRLILFGFNSTFF